jgi:hypothetical protein
VRLKLKTANSLALSRSRRRFFSSLLTNSAVFSRDFQISSRVVLLLVKKNQIIAVVCVCDTQKRGRCALLLFYICQVLKRNSRESNYAPFLLQLGFERGGMS